MKGRRREDTRAGELPPDLQRGDYWKLLGDDGEPQHSDAPSNLTGTCWKFVAPIGGLGTLELHTVREHEDGTISVRQNDGSSNSILFTRAGDQQWHGFIEHGVWTET